MAALSVFAKYVRPSVPGCPEPVLLDAILQACIDYCARTKTITQQVNVTTAIGSNTYPLTPLLTAGYEPVEVNRVMRSGFDLDPSSLNEAHKQRLTMRTDNALVFWQDENAQLVLAPTPDTVETLQAIVAIAPTMSATTVPDALLLNMRYRAIAAGAKAILMLEHKKQPWSDMQQGMEEKAMFDEAIAKEIKKRARGGGHKPLRTSASFY